ncbi:hypothetical protein Droror1_Dr00016170 [Drosera rotundifolia]
MSNKSFHGGHMRIAVAGGRWAMVVMADGEVGFDDDGDNIESALKMGFETHRLGFRVLKMGWVAAARGGNGGEGRAGRRSGRRRRGGKRKEERRRRKGSAGEGERRKGNDVAEGGLLDLA